MDYHLGAALLLQATHQQIHRMLGIAVDGGIGHHNALILHPVGRPNVVLIEIVAQIFRQHRAMEGANDGDIQGGCLLQQCLHLGAVLANDADEIAAGLVIPILLHIQRTKLAEAVGREQHLVAGIIGHDDFGPVDHGSGDKGQGVLAQAQAVHFAHHQTTLGIIVAEELAHHGESLGRSHHRGLGVGLEEYGHIGSVVKFHVLHNEVIRLAAVQHLLQIVQPLVGEILIHRVHDGDLLVQDHIRIVGHAVGDHILALKQINLMVVDADVSNIVGNKHSNLSLWCFVYDYIIYIFPILYSDFITELRGYFQ